MASDQSITLGKLITHNAERDAVHIAILPAIAAHRLSPGERVVISEEKNDYLAESANKFQV